MFNFDEDVQQDQTSQEGTTGLPLDDQAVMDIIEGEDEVSEDAPGEGENKEGEGESQNESEEGAEGSEEKKDDEESQASEESNDDSKSDEEKEDETVKFIEVDGKKFEVDESDNTKPKLDDKGEKIPFKENTETQKEGEKEEPFAKIGDQVFKTKEDLIDFTKSQQGFNRLVIGNIKKVHPDWFDKSGKLIPDKMTASEKKEVKEAEKVIEKVENESGDGKTLKFTEKDKEVLRKMGMVFKEDLEPLKESIEETEDNALNTWTKEHPGSENHTTELSELVEGGKQSLDEAWETVKKRHNIEDETSDDDNKTYKEGLKAGKKKKNLDNSSSSAPGGKTGSTPKESKGDVMDEILDAGGML